MRSVFAPMLIGSEKPHVFAVLQVNMPCGISGNSKAITSVLVGLE